MKEEERTYLTRKEAADYLSAKWFKISVSSLSKRAMEGNGPLYVVTGKNGGGGALYQRKDLDEWAQRWLRRPVTSAAGRPA